MRIHWWQSIRWRLALGSLCLSLLATGLLALTAIFAITYYYGVDQQYRIDSLANSRVKAIGAYYTPSLPNRPGVSLGNAAKIVMQSSRQGQYLFVVLNRRGDVAYPFPPAPLKGQKPKPVTLNEWLRSSNPVILSHKNAYDQLSSQVRTVITSRKTVKDTFNGVGPLGTPLPFVVQPILYYGLTNTSLIGVAIMMPRSVGTSYFVSTLGTIVLTASIVVAALSALMAILFSRTITRPLAKLTNAAHVLGSGNYTAQVPTQAPGELGELARTFNEMRARLNHDMEELRRQEAWRRELIMSISHDLATPLTAIAGLGESLMDGVYQSREDYEATGRIIVRETLRLRRLVKDLHVMAKMEAGALQLRCKNLRLAALVDEILAVLAPEFERVNVEPCNAIAYNLPAIQADPDMLTRVFSNLCDNALRHTPSGGVVTIDAVDQSHQLVISVTDTGEGIPPEALPRIFERFFRADSARQSKTGGSGLGLSIVRAIIEAHGGSVWAENVPDAGARISFTFPLSADRTIPLTTEPKLKTVRSSRLEKLDTNLQRQQ